MQQNPKKQILVFQFHFDNGDGGCGSLFCEWSNALVSCCVIEIRHNHSVIVLSSQDSKAEVLVGTDHSEMCFLMLRMDSKTPAVLDARGCLTGVFFLRNTLDRVHCFSIDMH